MTRFLSCQPDAADECHWLVLVMADVVPGPGGGPVFVIESSHKDLSAACSALEAANAAAQLGAA